ncbi:hypothetical protein GCM10011519_15640 [Marmoricola endophyticus]|uniref:Methyltransferase type 11 domain-containing protein n=1 Tax=Marmoricola endophyticus TaxID=2040280 RepID=A0A917BGP7_9ACTN|nr:methyltransferase domain-containing protein [Marmoricola endophyticus]GGF42632.1 hypothetical protein GCM10011519_15640 [Marmoricola endophyticus]
MPPHATPKDDVTADARATSILCPVCLHLGRLGPGPGGRPSASCRRCGSLERHRALTCLLEGAGAAVAAGSLLDVAPTPLLAGRLQALAAQAEVTYVGMDFDPAADNRTVTLQASLTDLPLPDDSVGLMVCFHVLEHIPDDAAAMADMARVLAPGGAAVVQVPRRPGRPTDEDPSAPVEERLRRFGQADHVRWYGDDFEDRLRAGGLSVTTLAFGDLFDADLAFVLGIDAREPLWLCTAGEAYDTAPLARACDTAARDILRRGIDAAGEQQHESDEQLRATTKELRGARRRLERVRRERDEAQQREQHLRRRPDVRVVGAVGRRVRRVVRRRSEGRG